MRAGFDPVTRAVATAVRALTRRRTGVRAPQRPPAQTTFSGDVTCPERAGLSSKSVRSPWAVPNGSSGRACGWRLLPKGAYVPIHACREIVGAGRVGSTPRKRVNVRHRCLPGLVLEFIEQSDDGLRCVVDDCCDRTGCTRPEVSAPTGPRWCHRGAQPVLLGCGQDP
jgi:hypothetical protein